MDKGYSSPFITEDIDEEHREYWKARRQVATAVSALIEAATTGDIHPAAADSIVSNIEALTDQLKGTDNSKALSHMPTPTAVTP